MTKSVRKGDPGRFGGPGQFSRDGGCEKTVNFQLFNFQLKQKAGFSKYWIVEGELRKLSTFNSITIN